MSGLNVARTPNQATSPSGNPFCRHRTITRPSRPRPCRAAPLQCEAPPGPQAVTHAWLRGQDWEQDRMPVGTGTRSGRPAAPVRCRLEPLEERFLLSGTPIPDLGGNATLDQSQALGTLSTPL